MEVVHVIEAPQKPGGICLAPNKCFRLQAPKAAPSPKFQEKLRVLHHTQRMRYFAEKSKNPDMNLSLKEIQTGIQMSDHMALSLEVYLIGVLAIFALMGK